MSGAPSSFAAELAGLATGAWPWVLAAAMVAAAVLALVRFRRAIRQRLEHRRRRRTWPRHPVVLAHGLLGFDTIQLGHSRHEYFRGIRARLEREGILVHQARVGKTASVAARAAKLAAFIDTLPAKRVNLVAHSMGGLDARYAVARLGIQRRVASVVTIGTPHLGTPIADLGAAVGERVLLFAALEKLGVDTAAFQDLTRSRMEQFNRTIVDIPGVHYASVVCAASRKRDVNPMLLPTYLWLTCTAGASDGLVPASSQPWGDILRSVDADHWAQVGWSRRFDAVELYVELLRELASRGL